MDIIFERKPYTDWEIIVKDRYLDKLQETQYADRGVFDFDEFTGIYRTGMSNGKQCEMFTLLAQDAEYAYLWVNIFTNGDIEYISHIPSVINTDKKNKKIEILPLVHCKYDSIAKTFEISYVEEHKSNYNMVFK